MKKLESNSSSSIVSRSDWEGFQHSEYEEVEEQVLEDEKSEEKKDNFMVETSYIKK
jgi:hypothetical protein